MRCFLGYDPREAIGYFTCLQSILDTSPDVWVKPLWGTQGKGTNSFNLDRFRVPEQCNWAGWAVSMDGSDMLVRADLDELLKLKDPSKAVQVVKHEYRTRHERKYIGTEMEARNSHYPRKNWSSVVLWNAGHNAHFQHLHDIQHAIENFDGEYLHRFGWLDPSEIGELPAAWNHLVGELPPNPEAKICHFTLGLPAFDYYVDCEFAEEWRAVANRAVRGMQYDFQMPSRR